MKKLFIPVLTILLLGFTAYQIQAIEMGDVEGQRDISAQDGHFSDDVGVVDELTVSGATTLGGGTSGTTATYNTVNATNLDFGNGTGKTLNVTSITGTLQTAAQPNITTVGNLSTATVTGSASIAGNVGIGISSASSILHIKALAPGMVGTNPAGQLIIQTPDDDEESIVAITAYESDGVGAPDQRLWYLGSTSAGDKNVVFLNQLNGKLTLGTSGTTAFTILGDGNVGIGTASPNALLEVKGASGSNGVIRINSTNLNDENSDAIIELYEGGTESRYQIYSDGSENSLKFRGLISGDNADFMTVSRVSANVYDIAFGSGSVGIGTANPTAKLQVMGDIKGSGTSVFDQGAPIITDATTARTLSLSDNGAYIRFGTSAASTLTIPTNASVAFPIGAEIGIFQVNAGTLTFTGADVTINSDGLKNTLDNQFSAAYLKKVGTDSWDLAGNLQ